MYIQSIGTTFSYTLETWGAIGTTFSYTLETWGAIGTTFSYTLGTWGAIGTTFSYTLGTWGAIGTVFRNGSAHNATTRLANQSLFFLAVRRKGVRTECHDSDADNY
ncbi:hypothetical protein [Pseudomonas sp. p99-361]|uniref:hypothetical protein n=1 Tax=Pseudomonas sp. p99-361 TaxID=2479852 RepID=UPI0013159957|nr:hypothetical protein [Pseudomonas sp. p99-361]